MPPPVALLFCTIFVAFLLRLDYKQAYAVSRLAWIPTVWALAAFSKPLGIWFGTTGSVEAGSPIERAFLIVVACFAIAVLSKRRFDWSGAFRENFWLVVLIGFMLISISWSSMPFISFKRWTREIVAVVMAFMILSEHDPRQAIITILRRVAYILLPYSLLLIKYYPELGVQYGRWSGERMWVGVASQKNGLAIICMISAIFLIWTLFRGWRGLDIPVTKYQTYIELVVLILAFTLLMGPRKTFTYSATSTVVFVLALLTASVFYWMKARGVLLGPNAMKVIIIAIVIYGTITPFVGQLKILDISRVLERDETLTGRSNIWEALIPFVHNRPVLGHGFGGFWTTEMRILIYSDAHNGYLDALLNFGFFGLLLLTFFLISCCQKAYRTITDDFDWGILFICYLLMAVTHNIAESSIHSLASSITAIVLFFSVSSLKASSTNETLD
jgi:exopolysaccharide production protein ExoQ